MSNVQLARAAGSTPQDQPRVQFARVAGAGAAASAARVQLARVRGAGTVQPTLSAPKSTFDPGEIVVITASNPISDSAWQVTPARPLSINGTVCTFTAPATLNGVQITVQYGTTAFLTVDILPAFWVINGKPATVMVNV